MNELELNENILQTYNQIEEAQESGNRSAVTRSTEKTLLIHSYLGKSIQEIWGEKFKVHHQDIKDNREQKVVGKYYDKRVDISVTYRKRFLFCLGVKFPVSSFHKNSNNYFENMLGETANIQAMNIPYAQILIALHPSPVYNAQHVKITQQPITDQQLEKYAKLISDKKSAHRPSYFCLHIVRIDSKKQISSVPLQEIYPQDKEKDAVALSRVSNFQGLVKFIREHKESKEVKESCTEYDNQFPSLC